MGMYLSIESLVTLTKMFVHAYLPSLLIDKMISNGLAVVPFHPCGAWETNNGAVVKVHLSIHYNLDFHSYYSCDC